MIGKAFIRSENAFLFYDKSEYSYYPINFLYFAQKYALTKKKFCVIIYMYSYVKTQE